MERYTLTYKTVNIVEKQVANLFRYQLVALPSVVASHTTRVYQSLARPYVTFASLFERGDFDGLKAELGVGWSVWQAVRSFPLVV